WDKPLSDQPQVLQKLHGNAPPEDAWADRYAGAVTKAGGDPSGVKEAIRDLVRNPGAASNDASWSALAKQPDVGIDLNEIHDQLRPVYHRMVRGGYQPLTGEELVGRGEGGTEELRKAGIPGIKYLDQGSRAAGEGSRNYVVFDDKLIDILRTYGWAGL